MRARQGDRRRVQTLQGEPQLDLQCCAVSSYAHVRGVVGLPLHGGFHFTGVDCTRQGDCCVDSRCNLNLQLESAT